MPPSQEHPSPQTSSTPLIATDQREDDVGQDDNVDVEAAVNDKDPKTGKRRFFGLGKKKEEKVPQKDTSLMDSANMPPPQSASSTLRPVSPGKAPADLKSQSQAIPIPSPRIPQPVMAGSPSKLRSSSPRLHSPASSEIFERNVQEPIPISTLQGELDPAHIPTHVITEDHIPPALEATTEAITSGNLNPDEVEIVTSASHQPAASVLEGSSSHVDLTQLQTPFTPLQHAGSHDSDPSVHHRGSLTTGGDDDTASTYGQLDPSDPRRLSFISFADVVQSEHQQAPTSAVSEVGHRDSLHITGLPSGSRQERSGSPFRSPRSPRKLSGGVTTPPSGMNVNSMNAEQSPGRSSLAGPVSPPSELTIETMRQAVRRTASGDLSGVRSAGMSPVSDENVAPRSRTNS